MNHGNNIAGIDWLSLTRHQNMSQSSCRIHSASLLVPLSPLLTWVMVMLFFFLSWPNRVMKRQRFEILRSSQPQRTSSAQGRNARPLLLIPLQSAEITGFVHEGVRHGHAIIFMQHHNYSSINTNEGGKVITKCFNQMLNMNALQYLDGKLGAGMMQTSIVSMQMHVSTSSYCWTFCFTYIYYFYFTHLE